MKNNNFLNTNTLQLSFLFTVTMLLATFSTSAKAYNGFPNIDDVQINNIDDVLNILGKKPKKKIAITKTHRDDVQCYMQGQEILCLPIGGNFEFEVENMTGNTITNTNLNISVSTQNGTQTIYTSSLGTLASNTPIGAMIAIPSNLSGNAIFMVVLNFKDAVSGTKEFVFRFTTNLSNECQGHF